MSGRREFLQKIAAAAPVAAVTLTEAEGISLAEADSIVFDSDVQDTLVAEDVLWVLLRNGKVLQLRANSSSHLNLEAALMFVSRPHLNARLVAFLVFGRIHVCVISGDSLTRIN